MLRPACRHDEHVIQNIGKMRSAMSHKGTATTFEECCRRASIARHMAGVAVCSRARAYFLELEDQWISQARKLRSRRDPDLPSPWSPVLLRYENLGQ
jgi:hypothetical protein